MKQANNVSINLHVRSCSFCGNFNLPDGTIAYMGLTVCSDCLKTDKAKTFRDALKLSHLMWDEEPENSQPQKLERNLEQHPRVRFIRSILRRLRIGKLRK